MKNLEAAIDINAPVAVVWDILTNFERYGEWNPFITSLSGPLKVGAKLKERVQLPNGQKVTFITQFLVVKPPRTLVWKGHALAEFLFKGIHSFLLEPLDDGNHTRFTQTETVTGLMVRFVDWNMTLQGYHQMNQAIKARAEAALADS